MNSVSDIPNELHVETHSTRFLPRVSRTIPFLYYTPQTNTQSPTLDSLQKRHSRSSPSASQPSQTLFVIVFGYPPDKYTLTVEYFKSLGSTTEPDLNTEIVNCFKIGYMDTGDAMRAVRKNGGVLGGSWMVGAKWAVSGVFRLLLTSSDGCRRMLLRQKLS
jgi:nuclear pore complex protein Nup53